MTLLITAIRLQYLENMLEYVMMLGISLYHILVTGKQQVWIENIMSDLASIICGVPQGSVLGLLKFCLYLLPLCSILKHHNIERHQQIKHLV